MAAYNPNAAKPKRRISPQVRVNEPDPYPDRPSGEFICNVLSNDWVNDEYKHMILEAPRRAVSAKAGQFFHVQCPSPDSGKLFMRRPMSTYCADPKTKRLEFLYKCEGRGTRGLATLSTGDELNVVGPRGRGFWLEDSWKNIVVIGRGVGLATLAPLSQLAAENGVHITAILSARRSEIVMSQHLFEELGAETIPVLDADGSSDVKNVKKILNGLIVENKADAFFTCGSNRLLTLVKDLGKLHNIPGQVAIEQLMACGLGACYICVRTFEVDGEKVLRKVCRDGPVFDVQETVGW